MGYRLYVAFIDGSFAKKEVLNHEIDHVQAMVEDSPKHFICRCELEDKDNNVLYTYKRKLENVY